MTAAIWLALAFMSAAAPAPTKLYVQADVVRVRARPEEGAPAVARLRIGAEASVLESRPGWALVAVQDGEESTIRGWVAAPLLAAKPLGIADALAKADATTGAARVSWLERAKAIDPARRDIWVTLAAEYRAAGQVDKEMSARAVLAGEAPIFFASCDHASRLQAAWSPVAGLQSLWGELSACSMGKQGASGCDFGGPPEDAQLFLRSSARDAAQWRELERLRDELPAAAWFVFGRGMIGGSPFARPRLLREPVCDEASRLDVEMVLGDCGEDGLATTAPLAPLATERSTDAGIHAALRARGASEIQRIEVQRIPGKPALREARFAGVVANKLVEGWALLDDRETVLALETLETASPGAPTDARSPPPAATVNQGVWASLPLQPGARMGIIPFTWFSGGADGTSDTASGWWIVFVSASGHVRAEKLTAKAGGPC